MTAWEPIKLVNGPEFKEVDPKYSAQNVYEWTLSREPEREWVDTLKSIMSLSTIGRIEYVNEAHAFTLRPAEGELQRYVSQVRSWVKQANDRFESSMLPKLEEKRAAAGREASERSNREQRARDEAANLDVGKDGTIA